jgi:hypothetical protein
VKTEAEIRHRIRLLQWMHGQPCCCQTPPEKEDCRVGGLLVEAMREALAWALDLRPGLDALFARVASEKEEGHRLTCKEGRPHPKMEAKGVYYPLL